MARQNKRAKQYICVFCEGQSEMAYANFLRNEFRDVAVINICKEFRQSYLFEIAKEQFAKNVKFRNSIDVLNEIWFFFDLEPMDKQNWTKKFEIIEDLTKLRTPEIRIRLLMTTGCLEYWLLLHYKYTVPSLITKSDKDNVLRELKKIIPSYEKGDINSISQIAQNYYQAIGNGKKTLQNLIDEGLPTLDDTNERNLWLCNTSFSFSTVQEAIVFLQQLQNLGK